MDDLKPIPGFDGYFASIDGYVYKKDPEYPEEFIIVGCYPVTRDSPIVYISGTHYTIASLVARTFLINDQGQNAVVFHLDGDPRNNKVDNLVWVTPGERKRLSSEANFADMRRLYLNKLRGKV